MRIESFLQLIFSLLQPTVHLLCVEQDGVVGQINLRCDLILSSVHERDVKMTNGHSRV